MSVKAEALFTGILIRDGHKIVDLLRSENHALCVCVHGKVWEEGEITWEGSRFKYCKKCSIRNEMDEVPEMIEPK